MSSFGNLGQSGFLVRVLEHDGKVVVSKSSPTKLLAPRLKRQFDKHLAASEQGFMSPLRVPEVLSAFENDGYLMELIPGQPLGFAMEIMSQSEVRNVGIVLSKYFAANLIAVGPSVNQGALLKIEQLQGVYEKLSDLGARNVGLAVIGALRRVFETTHYASSANHGDFSLENLITDRRATSISAVDFLDSPFETCLIDAGRLWLDLSTGWWATRASPSPTALTNFLMLRAFLLTNFRECSLTTKDLEVFTALAALRVLPYSKVPYRVAKLKSALSRAQEIL